MYRLIGLAALMGAAPAVGAHDGAGWAAHWVPWALLAFLLVYLLGLFRGRGSSAGRVSLFLAGWAVLTTSLVGPLDDWAHSSLAGHMVQHMILLAIAPPLLLLARPMPAYMQALSPGLRRRLGPGLGRVYALAGATPVTAFVVHGLVIWLWHLPTPYQAALQSTLIHDLEHFMFLATGLWFWWSLIAPGRLGRPGFGLAAILAVLTLMHTGMLGALMTFAPQLLYPEHPAGFAGFDRLSDQQLAGLIMWVPGGLIYTAAALALVGLWLGRTEAWGRVGVSGSERAT